MIRHQETVFFLETKNVDFKSVGVSSELENGLFELKHKSLKKKKKSLEWKRICFCTSAKLLTLLKHHGTIVALFWRDRGTIVALSWHYRGTIVALLLHCDTIEALQLHNFRTAVELWSNLGIIVVLLLLHLCCTLVELLYHSGGTTTGY